MFIRIIPKSALLDIQPQRLKIVRITVIKNRILQLLL